jgi:DNA polymerase III subunit epsilon
MQLETILLLDTETTGLDPAKDAAIEVAAAVYHLPSASVLESYASLIPLPVGMVNEAEAINRIPNAALAAYSFPGAKADLAWNRVAELATMSGAFVAHNAAFDRGFVPPFGVNIPWICTKNDLVWPMQTAPGMSLVNLALAHGLGVATAHRAATDVDLLARLLTRCAELGHDLQAMLARGLRPKAHFVSLAPFDRKDEVKAAGFQWNGATKEWSRTMAIEDAKALPFAVREVQP